MIFTKRMVIRICRAVLCGFGFCVSGIYLSGCTHFATPVETQQESVPEASATNKLSLLLPLQGPFATAGQAVRDGYLTADYQANASNDLNITVSDTLVNPSIVALYRQTVVNLQPDLIVGPLTKADVSALAQETTLSTPVLALNRADGAAPPHFYQFSLDPQAEAVMVAQRLQRDGYQQVYVIAPAGDWGQSIAASFGRAWLALGGAIISSAAYQDGESFTATAQALFSDIAPTEPAVVGSQLPGRAAVFLVANAKDARTLVPIIRHQALPITIYALPTVYSGVPNTAANAALNDVIFPSTAWQLDNQSPERQNFARLYPDAPEDNLRLYGFGMDVFALSQYYLHNHSFDGLNQSGYSGQLTLGANGVIERQLVWASFVAGEAVQRTEDR